MEVTETTSRRSAVKAFFASVAAAGAGLFGVAQAQAPTQRARQADVDRQSAARATSRRCSRAG